MPARNACEAAGGEILAPLAAVQLGGLVVATIAALVVIPGAAVALNARSAARGKPAS